MRRILVFFVGILCLITVSIRVAAMDPPGYTSPYAETLETLNFPFLAMLRAAPGWVSAMQSDTSLKSLSSDRRARILASSDCPNQPQCLVEAWAWSDQDAARVDQALRRFANNAALVKELLVDHLRPSGRFARYASLSDKELLSAAWADTVAGLNNIMAVYAAGSPPRYPLIDAMIYDAASPEFIATLHAHTQVTLASSKETDMVFDPALRFAAGLLRLNERHNAANYRPVVGESNARVLPAIEDMKWNNYSYSALLVFGHGAQDAQSRTGPMSYVRLAWAAELFRRTVAPLIIVSGGNVHPNRTPFNEAVEMKRILMTQHGIPGAKVLIEPHARHTTTNLRNSARLLFAAGFPTEKPALIVTDPVTADYIGSPELLARSVRETGVRPGHIAVSDIPFAFEFLPNLSAFHVESLDPLDP